MNENATPPRRQEVSVAARHAMIWSAIVIALAAVAGVALRLEDPLSDRVIPAEDPYTHMALVREHLADGEMEPLYERGTLYPPGMHSYLGAVWVFTGFELYDIMLMGPAVLGGIGIIGIGLVGVRLGGPVAGVVAALAYAVAPETIFRTAMMSPTALDLAILPYLLLALVELVRGRLAYIAAAAPLAYFLVWSHPWALLLLAAAAGLLALLLIAAPWRARESAPRTHPPTARGFAWAMAVLGTAVAFATWRRNGFGTVLRDPLGIDTGIIVAVMLLVSLAPLALLRLVPAAARIIDAPRPRLHWAWSLGASVVLLAAVVAVTAPARSHGFPSHVDLPRMFGWPILGLALIGFVGLPFARGPLAYVGASLAAATYPFVIYNPLQSPFWPHRTAVFFGIGVVLLVGVAGMLAVRFARWLAELSTPLVASKSTANGAAKGRAAPGGRPRWLLPAASAAMAVMLSVTVVGASPTSYQTGWYRLYQPCEMDALESVAAELDNDPDALVLTGTWQAKLVIGAVGPDTSRVWFHPGFVHSEERRNADIMHWEKSDRQVYFVIDPHTRDELPRGSTDFLHHEPWQHHAEHCNGLGGMTEPRIIVYKLQEGPA